MLRNSRRESVSHLYQDEEQNPMKLEKKRSLVHDNPLQRAKNMIQYVKDGLEDLRDGVADLLDDEEDDEHKYERMVRYLLNIETDTDALIVMLTDPSYYSSIDVLGCRIEDLEANEAESTEHIQTLSETNDALSNTVEKLQTKHTKDLQDLTAHLIDKYTTRQTIQLGAFVAALHVTIENEDTLWNELSTEQAVSCLASVHGIVRKACSTSHIIGASNTAIFDHPEHAMYAAHDIHAELMNVSWPAELLEIEAFQPVTSPEGVATYTGLRVGIGIDIAQTYDDTNGGYVGAYLYGSRAASQEAFGGETLLTYNAFQHLHPAISANSMIYFSKPSGNLVTLPNPGLPYRRECDIQKERASKIDNLTKLGYWYARVQASKDTVDNTSNYEARLEKMSEEISKKYEAQADIDRMKEEGYVETIEALREDVKKREMHLMKVMEEKGYGKDQMTGVISHGRYDELEKRPLIPSVVSYLKDLPRNAVFGSRNEWAKQLATVEWLHLSEQEGSPGRRGNKSPPRTPKTPRSPSPGKERPVELVEHLGTLRSRERRSPRSPAPVKERPIECKTNELSEGVLTLRTEPPTPPPVPVLDNVVNNTYAPPQNTLRRANALGRKTSSARLIKKPAIVRRQRRSLAKSFVETQLERDVAQAQQPETADKACGCDNRQNDTAETGTQWEGAVEANPSLMGITRISSIPKLKIKQAEKATWCGGTCVEKGVGTENISSALVVQCGTVRNVRRLRIDVATMTEGEVKLELTGRVLQGVVSNCLEVVEACCSSVKELMRQGPGTLFSRDEVWRVRAAVSKALYDVICRQQCVLYHVRHDEDERPFHPEATDIEIATWLDSTLTQPTSKVPEVRLVRSILALWHSTFDIASLFATHCSCLTPPDPISLRCARKTSLARSRKTLASILGKYHAMTSWLDTNPAVQAKWNSKKDLLFANNLMR
eukprot:TRINITY_DN30262_c0_g1_i1.p1 TRINITY_DN30262_c0_g1~~TRINITY_DN30262_c0_g1_i1.p1  ORF type:complete len:943 (+),score=247.54 TRINITY_DN30262_c0_g1_i1:56-2884(+)